MRTLISFSILFGLIISACNSRDSGVGNEDQGSGYLAPHLITDTSGSGSDKNIAAEGSFLLIDDMQLSRAAHTATLLKDGNVLICGGFSENSNDRLASAEIYEPSSKTFTKINDLSTARIGHSATLLPNGKVLIAGGYNGNSLTRSEIYDPETKTFSQGPNLNTGRYGHTATLLNEERIFITGGVGSGWTFLSSAEVYDIKADKFIPVESMAVPRESHTATLLKNGNVLITGGHVDRRENIELYSSSEIFNSKTNQFSATGDMNIPRHKHDAVMLPDGKVLINGGSDRNDSLFSSAEIYDPYTSKFTLISNMNYPRFKHKETSILLPDGNVLLGGGSNKAEIYNPGTGKFIPLQGDMGTTRWFSCATLLDNGEVLITGGYDDRIRTSSGARLFAK